MPRYPLQNPSTNESKYVAGLAIGMNITATVRGQARSDGELAKFPDLNHGELVNSGGQ